MDDPKRAHHLIDRRVFLTGGAAALALRHPCAGASPLKPNVIFILADDLGRSDLGCYGQKKIRTPNIDRLAAEGMLFTQAYAGGAVCAPARCTLMTGLHTGHATIRHNHSTLRRQARVSLGTADITVAQVMKSAGYTTALFGKWGLAGPDDPAGAPTRHGFDEWLGFLDNDHAKEYYAEFLWRGEHKEIVNENLNKACGVYTPNLFTREAITLVRDHQRHPFFLYLSYAIPHAPWVIPSNEPYTKENWTQQQKNYAAMTTHMDNDIGRIMTVLKEAGLDNNTIVFFSSDNGAGFEEGIGLFGSTGSLRGRKGTLYEGGIRVPMIARWPGKIKPGSVSQQLFTFWDFLPTAAAIARAEIPPKLDGISVLPALLSNTVRDQERPLYWELHGDGRFQQAVRIGKWKGVRAGVKQPLEIYDLSRDPGESHNLAGAQPEIVARMEAFLRHARTDAREYPVSER